MDVQGWLRDLGLEQYATAFRDNDVTAAVLPSLTAGDLRDLGVSSVGHRRRLLNAIAALRRAEPATGPQPGAGAAVEPAPQRPAERRHLSVMFCDLVGSTELSSRLDPEDLGQIIRAYQARVRAPVERFHGYIARYVGDGLLIYFGWPESDQDNAERAIRAALAIVAAVSASPVLGEHLSVHIGIATGMVVVGEPVGAGESRHLTAVGETPNLAARLQGIAQANEVVIEAATRQQVGGLFECVDLGEQTVKGLPVPVQAWRVTGEQVIESRYDALRGGSLVPLIGREDELDWLMQRWRRAAAGEGQVVLLAGEAGIGKSRLMAALEERLRNEPHGKRRYYCSPFHQETALYPVIARWERDAGFKPGDSPRERLDKLEKLLGPAAAPPEAMALIADLLSLPTEGRYPALTLTPPQKRQQTVATLVKNLSAQSARMPTLLLAEDIHWGDPSSLELLQSVVAMTPDMPLLVVASYRPHFTPPWIGQRGVSVIALNRLNPRDARRLAAQVALQQTFSPAVLDRIIEQADGMPLLIEELTRAVVGAASQEVARAADAAIPATLQASLLARLDPMPAAKRVAQVGAVIGREFSHRLLAEVADIPDAQLHQGLHELMTAGLLLCNGNPPDAVYTFKHALLLDAAYQTTLRAHRRDLHRKAATTIEASLPEIAQTQPELLAHHYSCAGEEELAIDWWMAAGDLASRRYAHVEARSQYRKALAALSEAPDTETNRRLRIDAALKLTAVSFAAVNPNEHLDRLTAAEAMARDLVARSGESAADSLRLAQVRLWLGRTLHYLNRLPEALHYYRGVIDAAGETSDDELLGTACGMVGRVLSIQGRFAEAATFLARSLPLLKRREIFGEYIWALSFLGLTHAARGDYAEGLRCAEDAKRVGLELNFATGVAASQILFWGIHLQGGNAAGMRDAARAIVDISERTGDNVYVYLGYGMLAWAETMQGDPETGLRHLDRAREIRASLGGQAVLADWFSALHAELLLRLGRVQEAIAAAEATVAEAATIDGIFAEGMARRTWAAALLALDPGNRSGAESHLARSLAAFEDGEARVEAARTHLVAAVLYRRCGAADAAEEHDRAAGAVLDATRMGDEMRQAELVCAALRG